MMERPSDGGIYRAGRGLNSANFEFPGLLRDPRELDNRRFDRNSLTMRERI